MCDFNGDEQIVMTPTKRGRDHTTVTMERLKSIDMEQNKIIHIGGGDHKGIVIYKDPGSGKIDVTPPELVLGFKVMLRNLSSDNYVEENWELKFWFKSTAPLAEKIDSAEAFLTELVAPGEYPKDYVGFIKKTMKLMQLKYPCVQKVVVEMKKAQELKETVKSPVSANGENFIHSKLTVTQEKLLEIIEAVYPNSLSVLSISKSSGIEDDDVKQQLTILQSKGLVKCLDNGSFMRATKTDTGQDIGPVIRKQIWNTYSNSDLNSDVKMVKQMPMVAYSKQPIIAIITAQYYEKIAVDSMIDNKETFVKYKTEGESNVYTLGTIGPHRVVSTKLPATGQARGAMIAAGSTTTRLLGSFPRVDYVFLVGVGGGVPHYTEYTKHVRLGDVVVSSPPDNKHPYVYLYCETLKNAFEPSDNVLSPEDFSVKTWCPPSLKLQNIGYNLWRKGMINREDRLWEHFISRSLQQLQEKESFCRPSTESDKLYMSVGGEDLMEVGHPQPLEGSYDPRKPDMPVLHFGAVGSGRVLMQDDTTRLEFADRKGIMSFDTGFGSVVESIFGNRKDDYVFIRGVSDYKDGTKKKEWQPYAALAAAAVMKAIICNLDACD